jgi:glucose/arabinose dehydrogenase
MTERTGRVRVYQNGMLLAEPALTLTDAFTEDESGILGLTVHPDFSANHFIYLAYTANGARGPVGRVMRFREVDNRFVEGVVMLDDVPAGIVHKG